LPAAASRSTPTTDDGGADESGSAVLHDVVSNTHFDRERFLGNFPDAGDRPGGIP
jgi:hypothetical protein